MGSSGGSANDPISDSVFAEAGQVKKALTVQGPSLAVAMLIGQKVLENRSRFKNALFGGYLLVGMRFTLVPKGIQLGTTKQWPWIHPCLGRSNSQITSAQLSGCCGSQTSGLLSSAMGIHGHLVPFVMSFHMQYIFQGRSSLLVHLACGICPGRSKGKLLHSCA